MAYTLVSFYVRVCVCVPVCASKAGDTFGSGGKRPAATCDGNLWFTRFWWNPWWKKKQKTCFKWSVGFFWDPKRDSCSCKMPTKLTPSSGKTEAICFTSGLHCLRHIILLSYFFQPLPFFWPHYLLYTPFDLFYSQPPFRLRGSPRLPACYALSSSYH